MSLRRRAVKECQGIILCHLTVAQAIQTSCKLLADYPSLGLLDKIDYPACHTASYFSSSKVTFLGGPLLFLSDVSVNVEGFHLARWKPSTLTET